MLLSCPGLHQQDSASGHHGNILLSRRYHSSLSTGDTLAASSQHVGGGGRIWKCIMVIHLDVPAKEVNYVHRMFRLEANVSINMFSDTDDTLEAVDKIAVQQTDNQTEATAL